MNLYILKQSATPLTSPFEICFDQELRQAN